MQGHHALQSLRLWVLAWFVMALGAAVASPMLQPQSVELICAGSGGAQLFLRTADGLVSTDSAGMQCPLCLAADAPPVAPAAAQAFTAPPDGTPRAPLRRRMAASARTHPPARAPPFFN